MKINIRYIFYIATIFTLVLSSNNSISGYSNYISANLIPSERDEKLFEVGEIKFFWNENFNEIILKNVIQSKQTYRSLPHSFLKYYYDNFKKNSSTPPTILDLISKEMKTLADEIQYFNASKVTTDSVALITFYNLNGYHDAEVFYTFTPDSIKKANILTFYIKENEQYQIKSLIYNGLDNIDPEIALKVKDLQKIEVGDQYNESKVIEEISIISNMLQNNGYYYTTVEVPPIVKYFTEKKDSVTINFHTGIRQKIKHIGFIDSTMGQFLIVRDLKVKLLDFEINDWYSKKAIKNSENNLNSLGTFQLVVIDTSSLFVPITDSTLSFVIYTRYKRMTEWEAGWIFNETLIDKKNNTGFEVSIMNKNLFGAAQKIHLWANTQLKDVNRFINGNGFDYEMQVGTSISQPLLWAIENMRIGANASLIYSYNSLDNYFNIHSTSIPINIPIILKGDVYLNRILVDFTFERQSPASNFLDFYNSLGDTASGIGDPNNRISLMQSLLLYTNLYNYLNTREYHLLTSNLFGITLIGDSRNHPFSPTSGDYFQFTMDGWNFFLAHPLIAGIARFIRLQSAYSFFLNYDENITNAFKFKGGVTYIFNADNVYVPYDRHFFSGGGSSVRGWQSRQLHYSTIEVNSGLNNQDYYFLSNILGSGMLLEGSYEFRYKFSRPAGIDPTIAEQISNIGLVGFVDFGNAFHWFAETDKNKIQMNFTDYFTKLAWAFGFGIRYDTPLGPVRLNLALPFYRPYTSRNDYFIFNETNILKDLQIHIDIGQSF